MPPPGYISVLKNDRSEVLVRYFLLPSTIHGTIVQYMFFIDELCLVDDLEKELIFIDVLHKIYIILAECAIYERKTLY